MTVAALFLSALALLLSIAAAGLALAARGDSRSVGAGLARHRQSHAERAEERRTARHHPAPPGEPSTAQMAAVRPPLPRPGQIGQPAPLDAPEDTW